MNYIVRHFGEEACTIKLIEECIELIIAIKKQYKISLWHIVKLIWQKRSSNDVIEEMADCYHIISNISEHRNDGAIYSVVHNKNIRTIERIKNAKY